jgi:hypothetical protein
MHNERYKKYGSPGQAGPLIAAPGESQWHPNADGYIVRSRDGRLELQHRTVVEERLGRYLWPDENVHHKNGDRSDNRLENLELWSSWQPAGQRIEDKVQWAREILARYEGEARI